MFIVTGFTWWDQKYFLDTKFTFSKIVEIFSLDSKI